MSPIKCAIRVALASGLVAVAFIGRAAERGQGPLPLVHLTAGFRNIAAEVAQTAEEREIGLMFREHLAPNAGMLFVFEQRGVQCFWMHNTLIPLSAAFIDDDGAVVNLVEMKQQTDDSHCSSKPVRFVLEMEKGWFDRAGIVAGTRLGGSPFQTGH